MTPDMAIYLAGDLSGESGVDSGKYVGYICERLKQELTEKNINVT
jgi:hypothetical protein